MTDEAFWSTIADLRKHLGDARLIEVIENAKLRVEIQATKSELAAAKLKIVLAGLKDTGACTRPEGCVCGGDTERVRKACANWSE